MHVGRSTLKRSIENDAGHAADSAKTSSMTPSSFHAQLMPEMIFTKQPSDRSSSKSRKLCSRILRSLRRFPKEIAPHTFSKS